MTTTLEELAEDRLEFIRLHGGQTWDRASFERDFDLVGYVEPDLVVVRERHGLRRFGTLWYAANSDGAPLNYFDFREHHIVSP